LILIVCGLLDSGILSLFIDARKISSVLVLEALEETAYGADGHGLVLVANVAGSDCGGTN
jgi:hypothetical protein